MIQIQVLFFGPARDLAGTSNARIELPDGATLADLRGSLEHSFDRLTPALKTCRLAVDQSFAEDRLVLKDGAEVAVVPPVSGG